MKQLLDTIIIGAGISGLTLGYRLTKAGQNIRILEKSSFPGGNIQSKRVDGWLIEEGPNSLLVNRQQILDLFNELGLQDEMIEASPVCKNRFILRDGALHALPTSPFSLISTKLFTTKDKLRLFKEPWIKPVDFEETVEEFVIRRLGTGFYEYAIDPFVSGVYAGDPSKLSARAATKKVYRIEEKHGSLIRGALAMVTGIDRPEGRIKGRMISFKSGMQTLPKRLAQHLGSSLVFSQEVQAIQHDDKQKIWHAQTHAGSYSAKNIVLATPAPIVQKLMHPWGAPPDLSAIAYAPLAVCHLGFKREAVRHPLNGFGCLVPRKEKVGLLGVLFSSTMFPDRTPDPDRVLFTCFIGGATCPQLVNWSDSDIVEKVSRDIQKLLGTKGDPVFRNLFRHHQSIPQYTLGHLSRMRNIQNSMCRHEGLSTRANWHDGISVADCILNSMSATQEIQP
ncbi:MAG: protoporphyrinogen oxidase [Acidobacteria bacterium]|nr:MAG: protoporphyrinogen oxidase [Acidobacteriota bacterium]PIE91593.1 MAG: protoporphyrinogen oxidase [Acidobacteriota bacterium]